MTVQADFWQLVGFGAALLSGFAAIIFGAGQLIAGQFEKRISERFEAMRVERAAEEARTNERFDALQRARELEAQGITNLEREFLKFQADLPLHYVRREDYVQSTATIMAKLDAISLRFENVLLQRGKNHE